MKTRIIQTRFWDDNFIVNANKDTRYLYMYLLTCQYINLCGIFQLSDKKIQFETGLTGKEFEMAKNELIENKKVFFKDGWVKILNAEKNNKYTNSPSNEKPYNAELDKVPEDILEFFNSSVGSTVHSSVDSNIKYKTRNIKYKNKNIKQEKEKVLLVENSSNNFSFAKFKKEKDQILEDALEKYPDKDCRKAIESFIEKNEAKNYKYKNYRLAFFNWVREDRFGEYSLTHIGRTNDGRPMLVIT